MCLVNGSEGIGTGWSTSIPCYNPLDICDNIRKKLKTPKAHYSEINAYSFDYDRSHPLLIEVVKKFGEKANGFQARLKIVEIPDDVRWKVMCDTSGEYIAEEHRIWR